jgi:hypothetical protein
MVLDLVQIKCWVLVKEGNNEIDIRNHEFAPVLNSMRIETMTMFLMKLKSVVSCGLSDAKDFADYIDRPVLLVIQDRDMVLEGLGDMLGHGKHSKVCAVRAGKVEFGISAACLFGNAQPL